MNGFITVDIQYLSMDELREEHDRLFRDEDMMDGQGPHREYVSSSADVSSAQDERVLAEYDQGKWRVEAQVLVDGEWYVGNRSVLSNPPDNEDEWCRRGRVKSNYGVFTDLSTVTRILLSPIYAIWFAWLCVKGKNVNLQTLDTEE